MTLHWTKEKPIAPRSFWWQAEATIPKIFKVKQEDNKSIVLNLNIDKSSFHPQSLKIPRLISTG